MSVLWVLGFLLLGAGILVMILNRVRGQTPIVTALESRGIHPHIWGYHLMVGGTVLTLILHSLELMPWVEMSVLVRGVTAIQALWGLFAVGLAWCALFRSSIQARPGFGTITVNILPGPHTRFGSWPVGYRVFLLLGLANTALMVLLVW